VMHNENKMSPVLGELSADPSVPFLAQSVKNHSPKKSNGKIDVL